MQDPDDLLFCASAFSFMSIPLGVMNSTHFWRRSPEFRSPGVRDARQLDALIAAHGKPTLAILRWEQEQRVEWHYFTPGKPSRTP